MPRTSKTPETTERRISDASSSPSTTSSFGSLSRSGSAQLTKRGKLKKKGFWSHWKEYYFVLEGALLLEYKSENASKPIKVLSLDKYTVKLAENVTGAPNSFVLMSTAQKDPIFLLAQNESEQVEWVTALAIRCQESNIDWGTDHVLEAFNDAVIQASERGVIIGVNEPALKMFGYKKSEMIGKPLTIIMPQDYGKVHDQYMQKYMESGMKRLIGKPRKLPAVKSDGTKFHVVLSLGEVYSGGIRKYIATMRPVAEESKKLTQDNLKSNFEQSIDKALSNASTEIKGTLLTEMQSIVSQLEELRSKNKVLKNKLRIDEAVNDKKPLRTENTLCIDLSHIQINERLADVGGSGANVYSCTVDGFGCVMKELDLQDVDQPTIENFMSEIALLESLIYHKNLVRYLFHQVTEKKLRLFTTRYAMNLTQHIHARKKENKNFTFEEVIKMALDIVRGLEVLHSNNIIHRDLKSDNIFVALNQMKGVECLVIGDFDTAKMLSENVMAKTTIGTPGYMAPEILKARGEGQSYGFAADIWSFGMVIYELMTLQRPFNDRSLFALSELTLSGSTPNMPETLLTTYQPLIPLWKQCLSTNPAERPSIAECKQKILLIHP